MMPDARIVLVLARRELRETLRRRSIWAYATGLAVLALALSLAGTRAAGYAGLGGFGRTSASLVNALLLFIPLLGFTAGASAMLVDRERGTLSYLLAQPVTRGDLFLGKALGALAALLAALALAFVIVGSGITLSGGADATPILSLLGHSLVYATTCLAIGLAIGSLAQTQSAATGAAITIWLVLVFLGDAAFLVSTLTLDPSAGTLLSILLANPAQAFRLGAVSDLRGGLSDIGPIGAYADHELGGLVPFVTLLALFAWTGVATLTAYIADRGRAA